ncbi:MAG TPA: lactate permease LctP family transporter [Bryobacteraceae bacterium]|jgi:lactate permease|nr:lactate permease LctP family transporter [Bryobacteraceae bacterium]
MWTHAYTPLAGSLAWSALAAALPIFTLLFLLGVLRKPAWIAALSGLGSAIVVAAFVYRMPPPMIASSTLYGAAQGLLPIGWIVFTAILLYRLTVETGQFEIIKDSIGSLTGDQRLQALLIAFAFGAFIEGAAGFGTPVAVAAAMLTGLGFSPFYAAGICLLANTAPVAFGSIGTPLVMLQTVTGLPMADLSSNVGRICAPVSLFIPAYLVLVMGGLSALRSVLPAAAACGIAFATAQFLVSNFLGPSLTDILGSLASIGALVILLRVWRPQGAPESTPHRYTTRQVLVAWTPYALLVVFVLLWGHPTVKAALDQATAKPAWPGLHQLVVRVPPVVAENAKDPRYAAVYTLNWLSAPGTACLAAVLASAIVLRFSPRRLLMLIESTARQLALPVVTIASVLGLAFLMNYSGATATLGMAFATTGVAFPMFSALLGWLGVFLTGSDTSANALFGNLQVVTAMQLHFNPALMAAANSSGGVMGKMISLTSIAVAAAATGMDRADETKLFRFTLRHSVFLAIVIGLVTLFYAYVMPGWARG